MVPEGAPLAPGSSELPNKGRIFTPFWTQEVLVKPATMGGANWPPSSYDPETHLLYVCATDRISAFKARDPLEIPGPNKVYMGGTFTQAQAHDQGILAALDVTTNRLVWRQSWREICYSGSIVTAGGLLFVGRSDGRLTALDKRNGAKLWEFMTDAGVNTTATTFEHQGKQYVVVHAGGGVFANGKRGDGIWMFSLDGTIGPVAPAAGPAQTAGSPQAPAAAVARPSDPAGGARLYQAACVPCHGLAGEGGHGGGPPLLGGLTAERIVSILSTGRNNMPAFTANYTAAQMQDIASYILQLGKKP
jgi:alcohol dehydrogenase (cytochrome c)